MRRPQVVTVGDPSQVGAARRAAAALATYLGFAEAVRSDVAIVVTEGANNALRHAGGGQVILQPTTGGEGLEALFLDRGPGMANVAACMRDGFSTAGTPGTGLGAIARLAHQFEIFSRAEQGTALLCRFWPTRPPAVTPAVTGGVSLPVEGESVCGDAWAVESASGGRTLLLVIDGLGHGPSAAVAAQEGVRLFREAVARGTTGPADLLEQLHLGMRATRGAAASVAEIAPAEGALRYAGVGNISATLHSAAWRPRSLVSHNGIVGHQARKIDALSYPWPADGLLVLHSDGLQTRWRLEDQPGLALRDPALLAGVLYRDFSRGRDDVTVVVHRAAERAP